MNDSRIARKAAAWFLAIVLSVPALSITAAINGTQPAHADGPSAASASQTASNGVSVKAHAAKVKVPTVYSVSSAVKGFTVNWGLVSGASGYQVRYSTSKSMDSAVKKGALMWTSSKSISNLKAKKKYFVQVRAYKTTTKGKVFSKWSAAKSVKTTAAVKVPAAQATGGTVYLTNTGECYHQSWCSSLRRSKIPTSLSSAKAQGYRPCRICC